MHQKFSVFTWKLCHLKICLFWPLLTCCSRLLWMCWLTWATRSSRRSGSMLTVTGTNSSKALRGCWAVNKVSPQTFSSQTASVHDQTKCSFNVPVCWFQGANPYLTFHCSGQGTVLIDLAPDDKEFQSVEEEVREPFKYKI